MDKNSLETLKGIAGVDSYLYQLARQSGCEHDDPRQLEITDVNTVTCKTCGKDLEGEEVRMFLGYE
jgi:hypothetical protein